MVGQSAFGNLIVGPTAEDQDERRIATVEEATLAALVAEGSRIVPALAQHSVTAVYAGAGYMTGQLVHIDLIEGASWLPWMLLAVHGLTEAGPRPGYGEQAAGGQGVRPRHRGRWAALLALSLGLPFQQV